MPDGVIADARTEQMPALVPTTPDTGHAPAQDTIPTDPDALALFQAEQEVAEEEAAAGGAPTPPAAPQGQPATAIPAADNGIMVPKAALDAARRKAREADAARLRAEGALLERRQAATAAPPAPQAQQPQQQQPTLDQQILAYQAQVDEAAAKYDEGNITLADFIKLQFQAQNAIASLRERALFNATLAQVPTPPPSHADQVWLAAETAALEAAYPWAAILSPNDAEFLKGVALAEQQALGTPILEGPGETLRLRRVIAELSGTYGPRWYPDHPLAKGQQPAPQPAPQARPGMPALPPAASARPMAGAKAALAAGHPPNTQHLGTAGPTDDFSDERIEAMSEDEIAALPPAVRERILRR